MIKNDSGLAKITKETVRLKLKANGLKLTPQRLAIIDVFVEKQDIHPSARSVYEEAKKRKKGLSLSTTYATLNEFTRLGIIKTLQFDSMENRYEGNLEDHLNLICAHCGKILDYRIPPLSDQQEIANKTGFSVTDTRLEYYGYCSDCQGKTKKDGKIGLVG